MKKINILTTTFVAALASLLLASAVQAHTDQAVNEQAITAGFVAGNLHPLAGADHLLAMVAVGLWGAALRAPLIWALPVVFPLLMVAGGVLGILGVQLPFVETGIALSVLVLGLAIAAMWRAPVPVALAIVAVFGILHGHAHGTELPSAALPAAYAAGFVTSTGLLHLAGIALGSLRSVRHGSKLLRAVGGAIALAGAWLLLGSPGL
jgi:urease accessory protein